MAVFAVGSSLTISPAAFGLNMSACLNHRMMVIWGARWVTVSAPSHIADVSTFCLDYTEMSEARYSRCVAAGRCSPIPANCSHGPQFPASCIDESQAAAACRFDGLRLPTEDEWERAAIGASVFDVPGTLLGRAPLAASAAWQHFRGLPLHEVGHDLATIRVTAWPTWEGTFPSGRPRRGSFADRMLYAAAHINM